MANRRKHPSQLNKTVPQFESYDAIGNHERVAKLRDAGVDIWGPDRVYVSADVKLGNIEAGATIHHATLTGAGLQIGRGTRIGASGHALVSDCQIGRDVELGAGSYEGATILDRTRVRGYAELRPGTLLEEQVDAAHNVAFKNTVLTANVVTGSLINYCDVFMSGGTSRTNHSEVGSGVVHFNFDPRGDKWSSLIGDVRGLLLRSAPVFVGGQCGLVAPVRVDFGAVLAAGSVIRGDVGPERVNFEAAENGVIEDFDAEIYTGLKRKFLATAKVVGNLWALDCWYEHVRLAFAAENRKPLYQAARRQLTTHVSERVRRLMKIIDKLGRSIEKSSKTGDSRLKALHGEHRMLIEQRQQIDDLLMARPEAPEAPKAFLDAYEAGRADGNHLEAVRKLDETAAALAQRWLLHVAAAPHAGMTSLFDSAGPA